jgi:hypothetical protein
MAVEAVEAELAGHVDGISGVDDGLDDVNPRFADS